MIDSLKNRNNFKEFNGLRRNNMNKSEVQKVLLQNHLSGQGFNQDLREVLSQLQNLKATIQKIVDENRFTAKTIESPIKKFSDGAS